jgi:hypothetical protein
MNDPSRQDERLHTTQKNMKLASRRIRTLRLGNRWLPRWANGSWKDFSCEGLKAIGANALKQHAWAVPDKRRALKSERTRKRLKLLRHRTEGGKNR